MKYNKLEQESTILYFWTIRDNYLLVEKEFMGNWVLEILKI